MARGRFSFGRNPRFGVFLGPRPFFHRRRFFFCRFPCTTRFPFVSAYPFYPYYPLGYQSDFVYSAAQPVDNYDESREAALTSEIYRLQGEIDLLRQQQESQRESETSTRSAPRETPPNTATARRQEPESASTVLVYRDGRRAEVQNYAVVGQTLWIFSEQRAHKVPLADLDLDATRRINESRGVEFLLQRR